MKSVVFIFDLVGGILKNWNVGTVVGYDKDRMAKCPFPVIPEYLGKQDPETFDIEGAKVTHIWTQDIEVSRYIAEASLIENIVMNLKDMLGKVDGVLLARDDGEYHLEMAKPFIEEDIPIFIDKPLTIVGEHLKEFARYYEQGKPIMSCSSMRYCRSVLELKDKNSLGCILTSSAVSPKYWKTYGIHLIEGIFTVMGANIESVQNVGRSGEEIVHLSYTDGRHAVLQTFKDIRSSLNFVFYGEGGRVFMEDTAPFFSFKKMLIDFVKMMQTGKPVFDWHETIEMTKVVIASQLSLEQNGRKVYLNEIKEK